MANIRNKRKTSLLIIILILVAALAAIWLATNGDPNATKPPASAAVSFSGDRDVFVFEEGKLGVAVLNVGQGDSILIRSPEGRVMLIDAGEYTAEEAVEQALRTNGIEKIDVLVGTHPHSDHIGGMQHIVERFAIGKIYMPQVSSNTSTFKNLLEAISAKGLKITAARAGESIDFGPSVSAEILAPVKTEYSDTNNYSAVIKLTYGDTSFLFTGDASSGAEKDMLATYDAPKLHCDVLKVGHHGSRTSSSARFLAAVAPSYGLISLAAGNDYGHPHTETLKRLEDAGVTVLRTDVLGTLLVTSDGESLIFSRNAGQASASPIATPSRLPGETAQPSASSLPTNAGDAYATVYKTKTGKAYHAAGCSALKKSSIPLTIEEAQALGLKPHAACMGD